MRKIPIHVIIFAIGPILSLFLSNAHRVPPGEVLRPLVVATVLALLFWLTSYSVTRDSKKTSIIVSVFFLLFFSYWYTMNLMVLLANRLNITITTGLDFFGTTLSILWLGIFLATFLGGVYLIARSGRDFQLANDFFNVTALTIAAVLLISWFIGRTGAQRARSYVDAWHRTMDASQQADSAHVASGSRPDIYYIILDGYARSDILEEVYQIDNSDFLTYLTEKGFFVADKSCSNYAQTALSLASSLNLIYLDSLADTLGRESTNPWPLRIMIDENRVGQILKGHGYKTLSFSTGYSLTESPRADIRWAPPGTVTMFENLLIGQTPIAVLLELPFLKSQYDLHRDRILFTLDQLPEATQIDAPTFVFAHIVAPHPPFVFGPNGEHTAPDWRLGIGDGFIFDDGTHYTALHGRSDYVAGYQAQLHFITSRLKQTVDEILLRSPQPPIIILQADHGPGSRLDWSSAQDSYLPERMSILNAYYLPGENYEDLYPGLSPVNTFRLVLDRYFTGDYGLLDDRSLFSTVGHPFSFLDVTDQVAPPDSK